MIVQRVLATKNIAHAKGATVMAGFLKILPMFIIVIPGTFFLLFLYFGRSEILNTAPT